MKEVIYYRIYKILNFIIWLLGICTVSFLFNYNEIIMLIFLAIYVWIYFNQEYYKNYFLKKDYVEREKYDVLLDKYINLYYDIEENVSLNITLSYIDTLEQVNNDITNKEIMRGVNNESSKTSS